MTRKTAILLFLLLATLTAAAIYSFRLQESKNTPIEQDLNEIYMKIESPPLTRSYENETATKDILKSKIKEVYFYKGKYRNIEYAVIFADYAGEIDTKSIIKAVGDSLKDNNPILNPMGNEIFGLEGILLEGFFDKDNKKYAIKQQFIKKNSLLWQILAVYPVSKNNAMLAERFINSIQMSPEDIK